jgi:hypothetical protein
VVGEIDFLFLVWMKRRLSIAFLAAISEVKSVADRAVTAVIHTTPSLIYLSKSARKHVGASSIPLLTSQARKHSIQIIGGNALDAANTSAPPSN